MAVYKVPQDVEADDKLIGPFSFRQFVYLIIVVLSGMIAWGLAQVLLPLALIPLPVMIFFGALALPLRKDQPMEIYMAAIASFYLKSRRRIWESDGLESLIEITVPKIIEFTRTKDISQSEAQRRLSYLAEIVDSQGWAVRGSGVQAPNSAMKTDVYFEAQQSNDILDINSTVAQSLNYKLDQTDARKHQEMIDLIRKQANPTFTEPAPVVEQNNFEYNPYPESIHQTVVQPLDEIDQIHTETKPDPVPPTTSEKPVNPGILNLANNTDLSIAAIAREANRINDKHNLNEEVIISLR